MCLQHGVLPGIAVGAIFAGLSVWAMGLGGVVAGLAVAVLAGWLARRTGGREDSQLAGMYLLALAAGVALISAQHSLDLTHILFGNVLAVDDTALCGMAGVATVTLPALALIWRPLVLESLDPGFMAATSGKGARWHLVFLMLVVLCVVSGFVALGTLMSVGLMMLPAIAARHWSEFAGGPGPNGGCYSLRLVGRRVDPVVQPGHSRRSGDRADGRGAVGRQSCDRSPGAACGGKRPRQHKFTAVIRRSGALFRAIMRNLATL